MFSNDKQVSAARQAIDEYEAQQAAIAKTQADRAKKERDSKAAVLAFLTKVKDYQLLVGNITPQFINTYLTRYNAAYGDDATTVEYLRIVVLLLTNQYNGVECSTHRMGNGGLIFQGVNYSSTSELYTAIVQIMNGWDLVNPKLENSIWLNLLLADIGQDMDTFAAETALPDFPKYVKRLAELSNQIANIPLPDMSTLSATDAAAISEVLGVF
ncbi:hypothetical protein [uncultured Nostoc sp.]|uniref:hypothetical protein n=1 Tax=uncultured Nostoc sp. TaxID=340711 RepID=UPI0035CAC0D6